MPLAERTWTVKIRFASSDDGPLIDALLAIRSADFIAPTQELAEHYATLIIKALEKASRKR